MPFVDGEQNGEKIVSGRGSNQPRTPHETFFP